MPVTVEPHGPRQRSVRTDSISEGGDRANSLRLRIRAAVRAAKLTQMLAEGADPGASDELAVRARQLTSERNRRVLARSLRRTLTEAQRPARTRARVVIIDRAAALDAELVIAEAVLRLENTTPVRAQGIAALERIITDAVNSPLYVSSEPGTLRRAIRAATAALDAQPVESHGFALAA